MPDLEVKTEHSLLPIERPRCPRCLARMMLASIAPEPAGYDVRTFECAKCCHTQTVRVVHDPMKSDKAGWIAGELKPPE